MLKRKIGEMKDSYYITIPRQLCDLIGVGKGTIVGVEYKQNQIIIAPIPNANPESVQASNPVKEMPACQ